MKEHIKREMTNIAHMLFAWPTLLADVEPGTELTFKLVSRGGVSGAPGQVVTRVATLVAA